MGLIVTLILAIIGIVLLFGSSNYYLPRKPILPILGFLLILVASYCLGSVFILKDAVKEREQVVASKETLAYQLVPFDFALSEYEMEGYYSLDDRRTLHIKYETDEQSDTLILSVAEIISAVGGTENLTVKSLFDGN